MKRVSAKTGASPYLNIIVNFLSEFAHHKSGGMTHEKSIRAEINQQENNIDSSHIRNRRSEVVVSTSLVSSNPPAVVTTSTCSTVPTPKDGGNHDILVDFLRQDAFVAQRNIHILVGAVPRSRYTRERRLP
jgi:hypothetical protein